MTPSTWSIQRWTPERPTSPTSSTSQDALARLYQGEVLLSAPTASSLQLVEEARALIRAELGDEPRRAWAQMSARGFFEAVGRLRRHIYLEERFHQLTRACISELGFEAERFAFDPARLRVINHEGHLNDAARPVYYPHRDTWYGHPCSLITWWIPLDRLIEEETFVFYPERFERPVPNDSEVFDYEAWTARGWGLKIGWQDAQSGLKARYPQHLGAPPELSEGVGFACESGEVLLFSGAHFHQTRPQAFGTSRFSLDFRVVCVEDAKAGRGAPSVDDRSVGDALGDYVPAGSCTWPAESSASALSAASLRASP